MSAPISRRRGEIPADFMPVFPPLVVPPPPDPKAVIRARGRRAPHEIKNNGVAVEPVALLPSSKGFAFGRTSERTRAFAT
ncbi:MAG: hypothetical protein PHI19_00255 [Clostridia bacterium]|nr:hypothetical protein [Clostridia bacterium]